MAAERTGRPAWLPPLPDWAGGPLRELVGVASLLVVALVPGAAMAASAITVAASAYCSFGSYCLYSGPDFDGRRVEYDGGEMFCQDGRPTLKLHDVFPDGVHSVVNNTGSSGDGVGVKFYSEPRHLVLTSLRPGVEQRDLPNTIAQQMDSLCAYPSQ